MRRALFLVAAISSSACGLILGIDTDLGAPPPTDVTAVDASNEKTEPTEASVDAPIDRDAGTVLARPPEGTYLYRQNGGSESIRYAGTTKYPNSPTVDVVYDGPDCFFVRLHLRSAYEDDYRFCLEASHMRLDRYERSMLRPSIPSPFTLSTSYTCGPKAIFVATEDETGTAGLYDCTGGNEGDPPDTLGVQGQYASVADGKFKVGQDDVPIRKFTDHQDFLKKGAKNPSGSADMTWSFSLETGMLVAMTRRWSTNYGYENGNGQYEEDGVDMTLVARPGELDAGADADADAGGN